MYIDEFLWLPDVIEKLAIKHQVTPEEIEDVFFNHPKIRFHEKGHVEGEYMYTALGRSDAGRYLMVFFIFKPGNRALIVSARNMNRSELRYYERKK